MVSSVSVCLTMDIQRAITAKHSFDDGFLLVSNHIQFVVHLMLYKELFRMFFDGSFMDHSDSKLLSFSHI